MPFAGYADFDDCVSKNQDKGDPEGFCSWLKRRVEGVELGADPPVQFRIVAVPAVSAETAGIVPLPNPQIITQEPADRPGRDNDGAAPDEDFHALLALEGVWTGDGRYMAEGALSWREPPLPLMALNRTTEGHDSAVLIGNFTRLERLGREIHGYGRFIDSDDPEVVRLQTLIRAGDLRGVSVDLDSLQYDVIMPMTEPELAPDADGNLRTTPPESKMEVTAGRIMGATAVPFPAFAEAYIESRALLASAIAEHELLTGILEVWTTVEDVDLTPPDGAREEARRGLDWRDEYGRGGTAVGIARARDIANGRRLSPETIGRMLSFFARHEVDKQGQGWNPGEDGYPSNGRIAWALWGGDPGWAFARQAQESIDVRRREGSVVAAGVTPPVCPPAHWFVDPQLPGPTPLTVTDDGRVYGHVATWGTCHIGFNGRCVTPPRSATNYALYRTGEVLCEDGSRVPVGQITMNTGHARLELGARPAAAHYDHTGTAAADVVAGEDAYGIWCAGALRPDLTPGQIRAFMAADISGDWRLVGGAMELVAVLSVNVPGFPKRRLQVHEANGLVAALVAGEARTGYPDPGAEVDRIAARIGRSRRDRIAALTARVKGDR